MFARFERPPNDREQPLLEQWVQHLALDKERTARDTAGWWRILGSIFPGVRRRISEQGFARRRHECGLAWMRAPRVQVSRIEASRVALLHASDPVHLFEVGENELFALDLEWFPSDLGPWPNSVFEVWNPLGFPGAGDTQLFCYGAELPIARQYDKEAVERHGRRVNSGFFVCEAKEGPFPGRFEEALAAYARYVDTNPPRRAW